ncbi:MAG: hypothetical protein FJW96_06495 [Actinobacteria bacterium]|nr:hypothetical protein [Actinomycetota bacterium]
MLAFEDLAGDVRDRLIARALSAHPAPSALLVTGSYACGTATLTSDLDLRLLTHGPPEGYESWFVSAGGRVLHVSFGIKTVTAWLERGQRAESWSLGFPARHHARYLWATEQARARLGDDPSQLDHPAPRPELEDCFEGLRKTLRAPAHGDGRALRWHARDAAEGMPGLLLGLNPPRGVHDRRDALDAALSLTVAPPTWATDLPVLLGVDPADDATVAETAARLGLDLLAFLRTNAPDVDLQPGLAAALGDGTLERLLVEASAA